MHLGDVVRVTAGAHAWLHHAHHSTLNARTDASPYVQHEEEISELIRQLEALVDAKVHRMQPIYAQQY